ncbi:Beta_adaptin [Hexamita inflata]|uniref:Beta adaptin n=1 Tax=Hexamita inflata TaxID=28002 RepID=A0AA86PU43_9EUKA|nr:Beta adaptin [Hexamita inflata]
MTVLSQATEWSALSILQAISKYGAVPTPDEIEVTIMRLQPFLRHSNPSVCLNGINVLVRYCKAGIMPANTILQLQSECIASIISLIGQNSAPEIQWTALRSLRLIAKGFQGENPFQQIQKNIRLFFVRFNDELYVKLEKIEALALICNIETCVDVVKELSDYCEDVQPKLVRAAIRAIGQIACKINSCADFCVQSYMTLLTGENEKQEKTNFILPSYAAQELMISIQDIFRTYPDRYERVIGSLCEAIETYEDPVAKASLIWILGEYCTRIEGVEDILIELMGIDLESQNLGTFREDPVTIQLAVITAVTRIFIAARNQTAQNLFMIVLQKAQLECLSPDVRSRAAFYYRLVQMDPSLQLAQQVAFVQKPAPVYSDGLSIKVAEQLSAQLGSVPSTLRELITVYKKDEIDSEDIVRQFGGYEADEEQAPQQQRPAVVSTTVQNTVVSQQIPVVKQNDDPFADLLGMGPSNPVPQQQVQQQVAAKAVDPMDDLLGFSSAPAQKAQPVQQQQVVQQQVQQQAQQQVQQQTTNDYFDAQYPFATSGLAPIRMKDPNQALKLQICFSRQQNQPIMLIQVKNEASFPIQGAQMSFAPNVFGLQVVNKTLPVVPAMGLLNGGQYYAVMLGVTQEPCNFPAQKMGQLDQQLASGMNIITFSIQIPNGQMMQYQTKIPMNVAFTEESTWHSAQRDLLDQYQANIAISQTWQQWGEASEVLSISAQQLGANDYNNALQALISKLHRGNLNYITIGNDCSDYVLNTQINTSAGNRKVTGFVKIFYRPSQTGIDVRIAARVPQDILICGSFITSAISALLQGK